VSTVTPSSNENGLSFSSAHSEVHPSLFMWLIIPFGALSGYLGVSLAYVLTEAKISAGAVAGLVALSYLPHTWKVFWAPLLDLTLTRKAWYAIGMLGTVLGLVSMGLTPLSEANMPLLSLLAFATSLASTFLGMSVDSLMAYATPDQAKGRAAGWFQAGNLGGSGLGGGAALWMVESGGLSHAVSASVLAGACLLCGVALFFLPEPRSELRLQSLGHALGDVWRELWSLARARSGALALLVCFLPIGSGAASNLWSVIAPAWQTPGETVALINGLASGVISAIGCLMGGYVCDRMDRKLAYCLFGLAQAACALAMGLAPHNEFGYVVFTSLYAFIAGLTFAAFSAVVLEAIGRGAAATKYNLLASLSNMPILVMTAINGWTYERWGGTWMLAGEALVGVAALLLFALVARLSRRQSGCADS
jgi:PAT family beta-lactamase induction signal transducer AmpG